MSDDLVKRARDCANGVGSFKTDRGDFGLIDDLADRIEALTARVKELEDAIDSAEIKNGLTDNGNLWRFWSRQATESSQRNTALAAQLAQRDAALKAADDLADSWRKYRGLFCEGDEDLVESALDAYRKARGQDA